MITDYSLLDCHASRLLKAIEAVLEGKATDDVVSVEMQGRKITRFSFDELVQARRRYLTEYQAELRMAGLLTRKTKIKTRF